MRKILDRRLRGFDLVEKYHNSVAKTTGLSLYEHTLNLLNQSKNIINFRKNSIIKYAKYFN